MRPYSIGALNLFMKEQAKNPSLLIVVDEVEERIARIPSDDMKPEFSDICLKFQTSTITEFPTV